MSVLPFVRGVDFSRNQFKVSLVPQKAYSEHPNSYYIINDCSLCNTDTAGPVSNKDGGDEQSEMAEVES
jgi:hypothetical protein